MHSNNKQFYFNIVLNKFYMKQQDPSDKFPTHRVLGSQEKEEFSTSLPKDNKPYSPNPKRTFIQQPRFSAVTATNRTSHRLNGYFQGSKVQSRSKTTTFLEGRTSKSRTIDQIQNQNSFLVEQLGERDDLIRSFKRSQIQNGEPHSEEIINNLNLRLASKNVLLDKISKHISEFEQRVRSQSLQIHPECRSSMTMIQQWIQQNENHPTTVRQRLIETSHQAERHYIFNESYVKEWEFKLQQSYKQIHTLRQKVLFYENEQQRSNAVHQNMHMEINNLNAMINKLQTETQMHLQNSRKQGGQLQRYQQHIQVLTAENTNLKNELNNNIQQLNHLQNQLKNYAQQVHHCKGENQNLTQQITQFQSENNFLNQQIAQLKQQNHNTQQQIHQYKVEINNYINQLTAINQQTQNYHITIQQLKGEIQMTRRQSSPQKQPRTDEWKLKYEQLYEESVRYKEQINYLNFQVLDLKKKSNTSPTKEPTFIVDDEDDAKWKRQISVWKRKHEELSDRYEELESKYASLSNANRQLQKWRLQYQNSQFEISNLQMQINSLNSKVRRLEDDENYSIMEWKIKYEEASNSLRHTRSQLQQFRSTGTQEFFHDYSKKEQVDVGRYIQEVEEIKRMYDHVQTEIRNLQIEKIEWESERAMLLDEKEKLLIQLQTGINVNMEEELQRRKEQVIQQYREKITIEIKEEIEIRIREQLEVRIRQELDIRIREQLDLRIREQIEIRIREQLEVEIREFYEAAFLQKMTEESNRFNEQWRNREQEIASSIQAQIKDKIIIQVTESVRNAIYEEVYISIREEFESKTNQNQEKLLQYESRNERLVAETQRLSNIIIGLQAKFEELLQKQSTPQEEQIKNLQQKIIEQERSIAEGRNFLEQAENYIQALLKQLEEKGQKSNDASESVIKNFQVQINELNLLIGRYESEIDKLTVALRDAERINNQTYEKLEKAEEYIGYLMNEQENRPQVIDDEALNEQRKIWEQERETIATERSRWEEQRQKWKQWSVKWETQRNEVAIQKKAWKQERQQWIQATQKWVIERNSWEQEKKTWEIFKVEWNGEKQALANEIVELKNHLIRAEDYIQASAKESEMIISDLERQLNEYKNKQYASEDDEFRYMIDARFELLSQKIMEIAMQQDSESESQAQFLKLYMARRQEQSQVMRRKINEGLQIINNFEQVLILKRSEFKRLNLNNLSEFLNYMDRLRSTEVDLNTVGSEQFLQRLRQVYNS